MTMKKIYIALIFLLLILPIYQAATNNNDNSEKSYSELLQEEKDAGFENMGCVKENNSWMCPKPVLVSEIEGIINGDVECYISNESSTCQGNQCADQIESGCWGFVSNVEEMEVELCYDKVSEDDLINDYICDNVTINEISGEQGILSMINPIALDLDKCTSELDKDSATNITLRVLVCPLGGTRITFNAAITATGFMIADILKSEPTDIIGIVKENYIYIGLGILILAALYFGLLKKR